MVSSAPISRAGDAGEASGVGIRPSGVQPNTDRARFEQELQELRQLVLDREPAARRNPQVPVEVRGQDGFHTLKDAARAALARANPGSIAEDIEYGGCLFTYRDKLRKRYGYTGPERGTSHYFATEAPAVAPPANSKLAGFYHTHGRYKQYIPGLGSPANDKFSAMDLRYQKSLASEWPGELPEERVQRVKDLYGVPPVKGKDMRFYLGCPNNEIREHIPGREPSDDKTRAEYPDVHQPIEAVGTDRVIGRLPGRGSTRPQEEPIEFPPLPPGDWTTGMGEPITNASTDRERPRRRWNPFHRS
jgi:hypothetical protein